MVEKGDLVKYLVIGLICVGLAGLLLVLRARMTGYAVYYEGPGEGQTTLMLQVADSDNLGDVYVDKSTPNRNYGDKDYFKIQRVTWQRAYLKFNISGVPDSQIIDNASLCLYLFSDQGSQTISANHVYDDSWCEGDGGTDATPSCEITWNNQPCGTGTESLNSSFCNTTAESNIITDTNLDNTWQCWNIVNMIKQEYNSNNKNISIILWTIDTGNADIFYTKEYTDSNLRPYLNVTYHTANTAPSIILDYPQEEATYDYNESLDLNFSVSDIDDNIDSCWYNIDNEENITLVNCQNTTFNISEGFHQINVYSNDSFGLEVSDSVDFVVSMTGVLLSVLEPSGAKSSKTGIPVQFLAIGDNLTCWYAVEWSTGGIVIDNTTLINCSDASFDVSVDGNYVLYLYANNSLGIFNSANSSFSVDTSSSSSNGGGGGGGGGSSGSSIAVPDTQTAKLLVSGIRDIVAREGDKKTLSLNVKNTGKIFLNNCRLIARGDISSWIYSTKVSGVAPGESVDFAFDLNVPKGIEMGDYSGKLETKCDEEKDIQEIVVSIPKGFKLIEIKDVRQEDNVLVIIYEFDNSNVIGDEASVDIWLEDSDGYEITRFSDVFNINKDGLIERNIEIELENVAGIYYVYLALSDDLSNFIEESVVLGEPEGTGFVIFDTTKGKIGVYIVFLLVIGAGVFFIWRRHGKTKHSKSKWFFGKKHKK